MSHPTLVRKLLLFALMPVLAVLAACSSDDKFVCLPDGVEIPTEPSALKSQAVEEQYVTRGGNMHKKIARYFALYEKGDKDGLSAYMLAYLYNFSEKLGGCELVKPCIKQESSDKEFGNVCRSKLVKLRNHWIDKAIKRNHGHALLMKAYVVSEIRSDQSLKLGDAANITPEVLQWIKKAAAAKNSEALEILEHRRRALEKPATR